jgi:hypothetical protein
MMRPERATALSVAALGAIVGVEAAALHLTRNSGVVIALAIVVAGLLWSKMPRRAKSIFAAAWLAAAAVCLSPQIVYNYTEYGVFSIQSSRWGALNLLSGTNMESGGRHNRRDAAMATPKHRSRERFDWVEASREMRRVAWARISDDPGAFARFALTTKFDTMWCDEGYGARLSFREGGRTDDSLRAASRRWIGVANRYYGMVVLAALLGLVLAARSGRYRLLLVSAGGVLLITFSLHVFIEVQPRYHFAVLFLLPLLAGPLFDTRDAGQLPT